MADGLVLCGTYTDPSRQAGFEVTPERPVMGMTGPTGSRGIYIFRRDLATGGLSMVGSSGAVVNPSFLILNRSGDLVFAVSEVQDFRGGPSGSICSFALDRDTGTLTLLSEVASGGGNPCHLALTPDERFLLVANHEAGTIAVLPVTERGVLSEPVHVHADAPVDDRKPHAHFVVPDPQGRFILATDTTTDRISVFTLDAATGALVPNDPPWGTTPPGGSPRHLSFTPDGQFLLANGEADLSLSLFRYDQENGRLELADHVSTVPETMERAGHSTAQMLVHPSGRHVYVANRGSDTIAVFALNSTAAKLTRTALEPVRGITPRNFQIDSDGACLYVANQNSGAIECFEIDADSGTLRHRGRAADVPAPTCVQFG